MTHPVPLNYAEFVLQKTKPAQDIMFQLTPQKVNLWHMITGLTGEAVELFIADNDGEAIEELGDILFFAQGIANEIGCLLPLVANGCATPTSTEFYAAIDTVATLLKRHVIYDKPVDYNYVGEQLYILVQQILNTAMHVLHVTPEELRQSNMAKLDARYRAGYSDAEAQARADKAGSISKASEEN